MWEDVLKRNPVFRTEDGNEWPKPIKFEGEKYNLSDFKDNLSFGVYSKLGDEDTVITLPLEDAWELADLHQSLRSPDPKKPSYHIQTDEYDFKEYNEEMGES